MRYTVTIRREKDGTVDMFICISDNEFKKTYAGFVDAVQDLRDHTLGQELTVGMLLDFEHLAKF